MLNPGAMLDPEFLLDPGYTGNLLTGFRSSNNEGFLGLVPVFTHDDSPSFLPEVSPTLFVETIGSLDALLIRGLLKRILGLIFGGLGFFDRCGLFVFVLARNGLGFFVLGGGVSKLMIDLGVSEPLPGTTRVCWVVGITGLCG